MPQAIRNNLLGVQNGDHAGDHAGLILSRYLLNNDKPTDKQDHKKDLHDRAKDATEKAQSIYKKAFERWKAAWEFMPQSEKPYRGSMREFMLENRMIIGLGSDNVLEAGLTLHHTYGVPYIPGSAVKGICAHYCNELGKSLGDDYKIGEKDRKTGVIYQILFGDTKQAGMIRFHDALIVPDSLKDCLKDDVMTPHHSDYYGAKDETAPTDFDSPVPVTFLSVSGKFLFVISSDDVTDTGKKWIEFVWKLLDGALANKGIGGKTNSGYGFGYDPDALKAEEERKQQEAIKKQEEENAIKEAADTQNRMDRGEYQVNDIIEAVRQKKKKDGRFLTDNGVECLLRDRDRPSAEHIEVGERVRLVITDPCGSKFKFYVRIASPAQ